MDGFMHDAPAAMRGVDRWIVWRLEHRGDQPTKVPYRADGQGKASSTDPATWTTYDIAKAAASRYSGLGFVLGEGFAGVDLDGCRDRETGELTPAAASIVARFATYTEISPSGTGVKMYMRGVKPTGCGSSNPGADFKRIEVYDAGRYFAFTGERVGDVAEVEDRADVLAEFCGGLWPASGGGAPLPTYTRPSDAAGVDARTLARAEQYLDKIPGAVSGQGGHGQTYAAAVCLVHGFGLDTDTALGMLEARYNPRCSPPWTARELAHKVKDAASKPHAKPYGWLKDTNSGVEWITEEINLGAFALGEIDVVGARGGGGTNSNFPTTLEKPVGKLETDSPAAAPPPPRGGVSNVLVGYRKTDDGPVQVLQYRRIADISAALITSTGGWPKCAAGLLFGVRPPPPGFLPTASSVRYFSQPVDLWAWVSEVVDPFWSRQAKVMDDQGHPRTPATKEEFHRHLRDCASQRFLSVSILPHEPPIPGIYYVQSELPTATGKRLAEFLAMLNPETEQDRQLLLSCLLTLLWGGPMGGRPAFVFDSSHGMGSGKTATAQAIADIVGGAFRINPKEDWESVMKRLMSDRAMAQRCVLIDNVRNKLGGQEIETLITASSIDGWRPYHGNFSRPNDLTVMITQNAARGTKDIATRSVIIKIGAPRHDEAFVSKVAQFIEDHRAELIADCLALLAGPPKGKVSRDNRDRFQAWQDGPLARCEDPDGLAALIIARRQELDSDSEEAEEVAGAIQSWVVAHNPATTTDGRRKITRDQMRELLVSAKVVPDDMGKRGVYSWLCNMLGSHGPLASLTDAKSAERVWLWAESHDIPV